MKTTFIICLYTKHSGQFVTSVGIWIKPSQPTKQIFAELFDLSSDDPMYDCYEIKPQHVKLLQVWFDLPFEFDQFDYFLECNSTLEEIT